MAYEARQRNRQRQALNWLEKLIENFASPFLICPSQAVRAFGCISCLFMQLLHSQERLNVVDFGVGPNRPDRNFSFQKVLTNHHDFVYTTGVQKSTFLDSSTVERPAVNR